MIREPVYSNLFRIKVNTIIPEYLLTLYPEINVNFIEDSIKAIHINEDNKLEISLYDFVLENKKTFSNFFFDLWKGNNCKFDFEIIQYYQNRDILKKTLISNCNITYVIPFNNLDCSEHEPTTFIVRFTYNDIELCTGK